MKKVIIVLLIIFLCVADIFFFRKGLLPIEPAFSLFPVFLVFSFFYNHRYFNHFTESSSAKMFLIFIMLSFFFSFISEYEDVWYATGNHILTFLLYGMAYIFFMRSEEKINKRIFLAAFAVLLLSILSDFVIVGTEMRLRGSGFAENPNNAALRIIQINIVLATFFKEKKSIIYLMIVSFVFVFLTLSRSGLILTILANVIIFTMKFGKMKKVTSLPWYILKLSPLLAIFMFAFFSIVPELGKIIPAFESASTAERIQQITGESELVNDSDVGEGGRVDIAKNYSEFFMDNPLGYGTGTSMDRNFYAKATHNMYLREAIDYGVWGLGFLIFFIFRGLAKSFKYNNSYTFAYYLVFLISCFFTNGLFENRTFIICLAFIDVQNRYYFTNKIKDD